MVNSEPGSVEVKIDRIDLSLRPWHTRRVISDDTVASLAERLERYGRIDVPVGLATKESLEHDYDVLYGRMRVLAARSAGFVTVPAVILPQADTLTNLLRSTHENWGQQKPTYLERAWVMARLKELGLPNVDIADHLGELESTVSPSLKLQPLTQNLLEEAIGRYAPESSKEEVLQKLVALPRACLLDLASAVTEKGVAALEVEVRAAAEGNGRCRARRSNREPVPLELRILASGVLEIRADLTLLDDFGGNDLARDLAESVCETISGIMQALAGTSPSSRGEDSAAASWDFPVWLRMVGDWIVGLRRLFRRGTGGQS